MRVAGMLVTYPFRPARRRARARADSSRARAPVAVVTNLGARAAFAPATTSRARFSWAVSVVLSRTKRLRRTPTRPATGIEPVAAPPRQVDDHGRVAPRIRSRMPIAEVPSTVISRPQRGVPENGKGAHHGSCLLYTSDAADEEDSVDLGGRRIIKKN